MSPSLDHPLPSADVLPQGYELVETLRRAPGARALHARCGGREVFLRIAGGSADRQADTELAVMGRIDHPGLARLVDYGSFAGGALRVVARSWVPGRDLRAWAAGHGAREIGGVLARMCSALEHLHRRGFVHADLKLENVVVGDDGEPVLTDFGLSRGMGAIRPEISGSLYTTAPEVLLGQAPTPRSDLFSLGVMLHELLAGRRVDAREFYGRFPERPFLEAAESSIEELPEWSRELVASLVARDPARRPASAAEVGRTLAARLDLDSRVHAGERARVHLDFASLEGRAEWCDAWLGEWIDAPERARAPQAWALPAGEEAERLFEELRFRLALRRVPASAVDLERSVRRHGGRLDLDRLASEVLAAAPGGAVFLCVPPVAPWADRAAEYVARTWLQERARGGARAPAVLVRSCEIGRATLDPWELCELPALTSGALRPALERELEGAGEGLAELLAEASGGAASRVAALLERLVEEGWIVRGEGRARLHRLPPDAWFAAAGAGSAELDAVALDGDARTLLAALDVLEWAAPLGELGALLELEAPRFAAACDRLIEAGFALVRERGSSLWLEGRARPIGGVGMPEVRLRELHARRARALEEAGAEPYRVLPHRLRAAPGERLLRAVVDESRRLRQDGRAELALELARRALALEGERSGASPPELVAELALDWAALGIPERAEACLAELPAAGGGLAEEIAGWIELARRNNAGAIEHFQRAVELAGDLATAPLWNHALLLYEARRYGELERLFADLDRGARNAPSPREAWNLGLIRELLAFRRGRVEEAREQLQRRLETALAQADGEREASVRQNLGTLERRAGRVAQACAHFERASVIYDARGDLAGLAQARALLGGARREMGELLLAEPPLASALALRERLGDAAGARAVRGMLGLLYADRGRLRAGIDELGASARALREVGRAMDAAVLEARRDELAARVRTPGNGAAPRAPRTEQELTLEADPRILVARARAAWLARDLASARDYAERARSLAERLQLEVEADEARFLLHWLGRFAGAQAAPLELRAQRARQDHALLELLAADPERIDAQAALTLMRELGRRGRDDRAARLAMALARRAEDGEIASEAAELARSWLEAAAAGLTGEESEAARRTLLGFPDPWPDDLDSQAWNESAEWEMTVLSLLEINHRLVSQEDLDSLLGEIVKSAVSVAKAERGFLVLEEDGELSFDTARDSRHGDIAEPEIEVSRSALQQALRDMRPLRLSNAVDDPLLGGARSVAELDLRSILCVPFEVEAGLRGAIYLDHRLREGAFDERAEHMLSLLSDQAALAIRQVRRVQEIRRLNRELERRVVDREADLASARRELVRAGGLVPASGLIGASPAMRRVHELIGRAAQVALPVLVAGPSGTGKELAARALHELSPRKAGPFVGENCAALPPTLIEAELFGARRGAFTGAERDREGMFERAQGGTIFLDEIGELPLELQAKLLRVLESGEVRRLGDDKLRRLDFRLVAATNRDLSVEVEAGRFRRDLMYRLDGLRIDMPPLSERVEDVPELVAHFLRQEAARSHLERRIAPEVMARLCRRAWPGNVRELQNEVARLCALSEGDLIDPELVRDPSLTSPPALAGGVKPLADLERAAILRAVDQCGGDKRKAAELLGISRAKIYQRLKEYRAE